MRSLFSVFSVSVCLYLIAAEEQELLDNMIDDSIDDKDAAAPTGEGSDTDDVILDQGFLLQLNANGKGCSICSTDNDSAANDDPMLWDNAVNQSDIIHGLDSLLPPPTNMSTLSNTPALTSCSLAPSLVTPLNLDALPCEQAKPIPYSSPASTSLCAMQDLLVAEDNLGHSLQMLQMLKVGDGFLAEHTPLSLHSHVFGEVPDPAPIEMPTADVTCVSQDGKLLPFTIQKKEP